MNKLELIEHMAAQAEITKAAATRALEAYFDAVVDSLVADGKMTIVGFGTYKLSHRKGRTGRDPRTGAPIQIPPMVSPTFKAGSEFKERVKQKVKAEG